ncbi:MAG: hypothetical protein ACK51F_05725 [Rhodospirillales bacterium]
MRLSSGWGFEGTPPAPVRTATLAREGGAPVLRVVTGARSIVVGTWTEPGRFEGTIEYPQTDSRERSIKTLVLSKLGTYGEERPQVRERARAGTVFVLYVGAWNCPSCIWWKKRNVGDEERTLLARVSLREVDMPNFRDTGHDPAWPEDLKAIRDRYRIANGTPRFYVFVDGKLAKQSFGGASWQRDILPVLQRLVGGTTG